MSEEYLKQLNEKLAKAEKLLVRADLVITLEYGKDGCSWQKDYNEYLKTYKKVANSTIEISNIDANDIHDPICPYCGGTEHILLDANDDA